MEKFNRGLEKFWLYFSILVAVFCVYEFIVDDIQTAKFYLLFLIIPIVMYMLRRYIRIRMEKSNQNSKQDKS